jgi:prepilin-type N-terminal cleavage/methylation domain-containing protein
MMQVSNTEDARMTISVTAFYKGMTLLEVMLALLILGGSAAVVGEFARSAFQNAQISKNLTQAELLAESILAKVILGIIKQETAFDIPVSSMTDRLDTVMDTHAVSEGNANEILWVYSLEITDIDDYLIELAVTVRQNVAEQRRPAVCRLVRWLAVEPEQETEQTE